MINLFVLHTGRLRQFQEVGGVHLGTVATIWVDLTAPTEEELAWVQRAYGVTLPGEEMLTAIEASARYFVAENGDIHLRTNFLFGRNAGPSRVSSVAFVLARNRLFSVHADDLPIFRLVRLRARSRPGSIEDHMDVLLDLYATDIEILADALERVHPSLERTRYAVLQEELSHSNNA